MVDKQSTVCVLFDTFDLKTGKETRSHVKTFVTSRLRGNKLFARLLPGVVLGKRVVDSVTSMWHIPAECTG